MYCSFSLLLSLFLICDLRFAGLFFYFVEWDLIIVVHLVC